MIIACKDTTIKPEILEILAHLHVQGAMPASIYNRAPRDDATAIQQPPTLHMLSSRILTSLSDAAWRAHEKVIVDETLASGGKYMPLRPEVPGSAYRVYVAGLRPEIWLELVLWACLHGGFVLEGTAILQTVCEQEEPSWKPMSWRTLMPVGRQHLDDFEKLDYMYNTQSPQTIDQEPVRYEVKETISSEVVNAYVDAVLGEMSSGVDERGLPFAIGLQLLHVFRRFLERSHLRLDGGSWDAVVLRLTESAGTEWTRPDSMTHLIDLSPGFGGEVKSSNTKDLPPYVLDGSAAIIGIAHQALRAHIKAGNLQFTLRVLASLRDYTDANRRSSLGEFFTTPMQEAPSIAHGLFTSNYNTITYPAFEPQLPPTMLGPILDLATDAGAFDVGGWLLFNADLDGPLIGEHLY
ncbi:hypothetical protein LTR53_015336, partial [Teratosphaeriaceae sp. CCFEE 6253]